MRFVYDNFANKVSVRPSARLWKFLLEDLHPGLEVSLDETRRDLGV